MGKLTFRADDDLLARLEDLDASKSEVMREALRAYLDGGPPGPERARDDTFDGWLSRRVDDLVEERLQSHSTDRNVTIDLSIEGPSASAYDVASGSNAASGAERPSETAAEPLTGGADTTCDHCGEPTDPAHVFCPNCGEQRSRRLFCECGEELRTDWSFCPGCGRRTPVADVLDTA